MKKISRDVNWIEVSLVVEGEVAESVADFLVDHLPDGVVLEAVPAEDAREREVVGPVRVFGYLPVDQDLAEKKDKIRRGLYFLSRIRPLPEPAFRPLQEADWSTTWKKGYRPLPLGKQLMVVPSWLDNPDPERRPIYIDPGMAFGSGTHPSTQLCYRVMEELVAKDVPEAMIDVGCGSGILSIGAVRLGVNHVLGVDVDETAVQVARANLEANQVVDKVEIESGSVPEVLQGEFSLRSAPLVTANLIAPLLRKLFHQGMAETVAAGGHLILSGLLEEQEEEIVSLLEVHGLRLICRVQQGEWVALLGQNSP